MHSARTEASSAEVHLMKIKRIVREHQSRCMVVDPLSAIVKDALEIAQPEPWKVSSCTTSPFILA
jgi:hypothetical protein